MKKIRKIFSRLHRAIIFKISYINSSVYMKKYLKYLKKNGMVINGKPNWISSDVYFDGSDYSIIELNEGVTISREVLFLTHDFSMHTIIGGEIKSISDEDIDFLKRKDAENQLQDLRGIKIGEYSFIGARAMILPGTVIGSRCIIGAGSVVKGKIPDKSIVIGNPAKIIRNSDEWLKDKIEYMKEKKND